MDYLTHALRYAGLGWAVIPLHPNGKIPLTQHGVHDATTDEHTIRRWWTQWSAANIGIAAGASGLLIVDVDAKNDGLRNWQTFVADHNINTSTVIARTGGGGWHIYYRQPDEPLGNSASKLAPGVDTRGNGGYVVAPPSRHPSGQRYEFILERVGGELSMVRVAPCPDAIVAHLRGRKRERESRTQAPTIAVRDDSRLTRYVMAALYGETYRVATAVEGTRNTTLNDAAFRLGTLAHIGKFTDGEAEAALVTAAIQAGLGEHEAQRTFASGYSAGKANPRKVQLRVT